MCKPVNNIRKQTTILLGCFLWMVACVPFAVYGSEGVPEIKAAATPEEATVGELIEYSVSIAGKNLHGIEVKRPEKEVLFPEKKALPGEKKEDKEDEEDAAAESVPLYIIHSASKEDNSEADLTYITVKISLSYYRPGSHRLPEVRIFGSDKVRIGYQVPVVKVKAVNSEAQLEDIEPPLELGGNYTRVIILVMAAVVATVLAIFLIKLIKARRKRKEEEVVVVPPLERFLEELRKLEPEKLIGEGKIEEYVLGISMIFRRYISTLLDFDALEMTSDEIQTWVGKILPQHLFRKYGDSFSRCFGMWDLSKFAEFTPSGELLLENCSMTKKLAEDLWGEKNNG
jgi:hypothetical protein